jgi:sulfoxide reductase heme-binding subunit YedZ
MAERNFRRARGEASGMSTALAAPPSAPTLAWPWLDRRGRFSWLRLCVLLGLLAPGLLLLALLGGGELGAEPWKAAMREAGSWALWALLLSLAVTPLRWVAEWPRAATLRRMVGLVALSYGGLHLTLYMGHLGWDMLAVAGEVAKRLYLTIGMAVLVGLAVLGWTSTDAWQAKLGRGWKRLHRLVYGLAAFAVLHAFLQAKSRADDAVLMAGILAWLMLWRALPGHRRAQPLALAGLAVVAGLAASGIEYAWYSAASNLPASRILAANLTLDAGLRPAQLVVLLGLGVALLPWLVRAIRRGQTARATTEDRPA